MNKSSSVSFLGLLTVLFIGLKLTGFIDWSWWWVLTPLIFSSAVLVIVLLVVAIVKTKSRF